MASVIYLVALQEDGLSSHLATIDTVPAWLADMVYMIGTNGMDEKFIHLVALTDSDDAEPALGSAFVWYCKRYAHAHPERRSLSVMEMFFRFWRTWLALDALRSNR
jgi:hypothetical protein